MRKEPRDRLTTPSVAPFDYCGWSSTSRSNFTSVPSTLVTLTLTPHVSPPSVSVQRVVATETLDAPVNDHDRVSLLTSGSASTGTSGIAINGKNAHTAKAAG